MSATAPVTDRIVEPETSSPDPHVHWSCVQQTSPPLISLCGELMSRRFRHPRRARTSCPGCRKLAPEHLAVCEECRASHQRWGGL